MTTRKLYVFALLLALPAFAGAQQLVNCATNTPCANGSPSNTRTGDELPVAGSKINANNLQLFGMFGATGILKGNGSVPNALTSAASSDVVPIFPALTGDVVTTSGSINTTVNSTGGVPFGPCATLDCSNATNITSGVMSLSVLPGSSVRSPASVSVPIASSDNTNFIAQAYTSAWSSSLPAVGSSGITAGAYQTWLWNSGAFPGTVTPTTSTINGIASIPAPPGDSVLIVADNTGTNYLGIPLAGSGNHTIVGDTIYQPLSTNSGPSSSATPRIILDETDQQANTNTEFWGIESAGTVLSIRPYSGSGVGVTPTAGSGNPALNITRGGSGSAGTSILNILFGGTTSGGGGTYTFTGTGAATFAGTVKSPLLVLNGSSLCGTSGQSCLYQPASNQIGFGGVPGGVAMEYAFFDAAGSFHNLFDEYITESSPRLLLNDTSQSGSTNLEISTLSSASGVLSLGSLTDAFAAGYSAFSATRGASGSATGQQWVSETFGCSTCATTYQFYGNATFNSQVKAGLLVVNGSSLPAAGLSGFYNPAGTQLGIATNGVAAGYWDSAQNYVPTGVTVAKGTAPILSALTDCTGSTVTGGASIFFISLTGCSTSSTNVTFTLTWPSDASVTTGYACSGVDETEKKVVFPSGHSTTTSTLFINGVTTATISLQMQCGAS